MTTKLTLSIEKSVVEDMKLYAKDTQRSISEMVQSYFENIMKKEKKSSKSIIDSLAGSLPVPEDFDYDEALDDYYKQKYGI